jgi:hypothetical protein
MKQGIRSKTDPTEREIELALRPGVFIGYREVFSFVSKLEEVAAKIRKLGATEPGRAVGLYETFLAGCNAKADELDDSDGSFRQFAHELICLWIKARQASGSEPDKTVSTLLAWMDDDPCARKPPRTTVFLDPMWAKPWIGSSAGAHLSRCKQLRDSQAVLRFEPGLFK